jgi:ABC-type multidrug transport system permease subunit
MRDSQLWQMTLVRYREFFREPEALFWVFIFPILLAGGLGLAFRNKPADMVRISIVAPAGDTTLRSALHGVMGVQTWTLPLDQADLALRNGRTDIVVIDSGPKGVVYRYDPQREESRTARRVADDAIQRAAGRTDPVTVTTSTVTEPGSRYIDFVIPGLLGMNLMGSGIWGLGFALVDLRRKKLLKRLVATPMSRGQFLLSFLLSRLTVLVIEVAALLGFGTLVFGVPMRGPFWVLAVIAALSGLAFSGIGLLISSRVTTMEGASGLMNAAMLPMWILSGVFFSSSKFPNAMQPFVKALPLTAVNDALRANMLEGAGLVAVAPQLAVITAWLAVCFVLALRFFRWK